MELGDTEQLLPAENIGCERKLIPEEWTDLTDYEKVVWERARIILPEHDNGGNPLRQQFFRRQFGEGFSRWGGKAWALLFMSITNLATFEFLLGLPFSFACGVVSSFGITAAYRVVYFLWLTVAARLQVIMARLHLQPQWSLYEGAYGENMLRSLRNKEKIRGAEIGCSKLAIWKVAVNLPAAATPWAAANVIGQVFRTYWEMHMDEAWQAGWKDLPVVGAAMAWLSFPWVLGLAGIIGVMISTYMTILHVRHGKESTDYLANPKICVAAGDTSNLVILSDIVHTVNGETQQPVVTFRRLFEDVMLSRWQCGFNVDGSSVLKVYYGNHVYTDVSETVQAGTMRLRVDDRLFVEGDVVNIGNQSLKTNGFDSDGFLILDAPLAYPYGAHTWIQKEDPLQVVLKTIAIEDRSARFISRTSIMAIQVFLKVSWVMLLISVGREDADNRGQRESIEQQLANALFAISLAYYTIIMHMWTHYKFVLGLITLRRAGFKSFGEAFRTFNSTPIRRHSDFLTFFHSAEEYNSAIRKLDRIILLRIVRNAFMLGLVFFIMIFNTVRLSGGFWCQSEFGLFTGCNNY